MASQRPATGPNFVGHVVFTSVFLWVSLQLGPPVLEGELRPWAALTVFLAALGCLRVVICLLEFLVMFLDWQSTRTVTGKSGTSAWAKKKDFKKELTRKNQGPFWGVNAGREQTPLFFDYVSNAMTAAPAGSGKGVCTVVPMGMAIRHSKILADFKGELVCMLKKPLEARGEAIRILNPGGLWRERIGASDSYNPLDIIAGDLNRPGGLRDVSEDLREITGQILPEPLGQESENTYFREGSRRAIAFAMLIETMIEEYEATLSSVALLIEDRGGGWKTTPGGWWASMGTASLIRVACFRSSKRPGRKGRPQRMWRSSPSSYGHGHKTSFRS